MSKAKAKGILTKIPKKMAPKIDHLGFQSLFDVKLPHCSTLLRIRNLLMTDLFFLVSAFEEKRSERKY